MHGQSITPADPCLAWRSLHKPVGGFSSCEACQNCHCLAWAPDVAVGECRLLTCTFLHAGLLHLGLNCYALFSIGPDVEAVLGYRTFATIYILSGLGGSIASFLFSDLVTVAASGAIFGLLGAHTALCTL